MDQGIKFLILLLMIFLHIVDDFYLQRILASMKQKEWWKQNAPDKLYKNDYLMALYIHSFSWSFMIHLPLFIYSYITGGDYYFILFIINLIIHFVTDDAKANLKKINLIQDQSIHMIQIIITHELWLVHLPIIFN